MRTACVVGFALTLTSAAAISRPALRARWSATDGFSDASFCSFDAERYQGMVDDEERTTLFAEAIRDALRRRPGSVVLDIGTGPQALLALIAGRAGAKKVYAVEVQPEVAALARQAIANAVEAGEVPAGVIEVHEGFSTALELPEQADLLVAEIVGSVASGEGIYATMHDAQQRLMRRPYEAESYIPRAVETWCAPMSYAQHHPLLAPRGFDWEAVRREIGVQGARVRGVGLGLGSGSGLRAGPCNRSAVCKGAA